MALWSTRTRLTACGFLALLATPRGERSAISQFEDDSSPGTPDRLTAKAAQALQLYLRYEAAVTRHLRLLEDIRAARAQHTVIMEAATQARDARASAASARASLREAMRSEVAGLRGAAVAPEHVLRLIHDGLVAAAPGLGLHRDDLDRLRGEMIQWAIADYFAAA